jgi:hypothetical protein
MVWKPCVLTLLTLTALAQTVPDAKTWNEKRRPELMALFESQVYGKTPSDTLAIHAGETAIDRKALGGKAIRKQTTRGFSRTMFG